MVLFLLFLISFALIAALICRKVWQIRSGKIDPETREASHLHLPRINVHLIKDTAGEYAKKYGHEAVLFGLKIWVKTNYFIKKKVEVIAPKVKDAWNKAWGTITHHRTKKKGGAVSHFLNSISEYKARLSHLKEKMEKQHEKNDIGK